MWGARVLWRQFLFPGLSEAFRGCIYLLVPFKLTSFGCRVVSTLYFFMVVAFALAVPLSGLCIVFPPSLLLCVNRLDGNADGLRS